MPGTKKSYGIVCCRANPKKGLEILMIKKSTTYHYCEFVAGHYKRNNDLHLKKLFNNMTYGEKMDILSMKFENMWYRIYMENPDKVYFQGSQNIWAGQYIKKRTKFERSFFHDSGESLRNLIADSRNVETPWEIPKGRRDESKKESEIETAIREFEEETGVDTTKYIILWHLTPYVETYTDFGTTYQNTYYYAQAIGEWEPVYKFYDKKQLSEVSNIKWVSQNDLKNMQLEEVTYKRLMQSFYKISKKYRNNKQCVKAITLQNTVYL